MFRNDTHDDFAESVVRDAAADARWRDQARARLHAGDRLGHETIRAIRRGAPAIAALNALPDGTEGWIARSIVLCSGVIPNTELMLAITEGDPAMREALARHAPLTDDNLRTLVSGEYGEGVAKVAAYRMSLSREVTIIEGPRHLAS